MKPKNRTVDYGKTPSRSCNPEELISSDDRVHSYNRRCIHRLRVTSVASDSFEIISLITQTSRRSILNNYLTVCCCLNFQALVNQVSWKFHWYESKRMTVHICNFSNTDRPKWIYFLYANGIFGLWNVNIKALRQNYFKCKIDKKYDLFVPILLSLAEEENTYVNL